MIDLSSLPTLQFELLFADGTPVRVEFAPGYNPEGEIYWSTLDVADGAHVGPGIPHAVIEAAFVAVAYFDLSDEHNPDDDTVPAEEPPIVKATSHIADALRKGLA